MQQFHINKPTFKPTFYANEKKSPKELLSPQIIFIFIEGSPVNKSVKYQNRGTMGVQIPFSFPKGLDFKPFQAKVRVLPWQINNTFILPILSPHIFSKPCKCEGLVRMFLRFRFCGIVCCVLYRFPFPQSDL